MKIWNENTLCSTISNWGTLWYYLYELGEMGDGGVSIQTETAAPAADDHGWRDGIQNFPSFHLLLISILHPSVVPSFPASFSWHTIRNPSSSWFCRLQVKEACRSRAGKLSFHVTSVSHLCEYVSVWWAKPAVTLQDPMLAFGHAWKTLTSNLYIWQSAITGEMSFLFVLSYTCLHAIMWSVLHHVTAVYVCSCLCTKAMSSWMWTSDFIKEKKVCKGHWPPLCTPSFSCTPLILHTVFSSTLCI